jgi:hypothetical protein
MNSFYPEESQRLWAVIAIQAQLNPICHTGTFNAGELVYEINNRHSKKDYP